MRDVEFFVSGEYVGKMCIKIHVLRIFEIFRAFLSGEYVSILTFFGHRLLGEMVFLEDSTSVFVVEM